MHPATDLIISTSPVTESSTAPPRHKLRHKKSHPLLWNALSLKWNVMSSNFPCICLSIMDSDCNESRWRPKHWTSVQSHYSFRGDEKYIRCVYVHFLNSTLTHGLDACHEIPRSLRERFFVCLCSFPEWSAAHSEAINDVSKYSMIAAGLRGIFMILTTLRGLVHKTGWGICTCRSWIDDRRSLMGSDL